MLIRTLLAMVIALGTLIPLAAMDNSHQNEPRPQCLPCPPSD